MRILSILIDFEAVEASRRFGSRRVTPDCGPETGLSLVAVASGDCPSEYRKNPETDLCTDRLSAERLIQSSSLATRRNEIGRCHRQPQPPRRLCPACALDSLLPARCDVGARWETIVMVALADLPPAAAWMTAVPDRDGAVYRPVELIEPRPLTFDQVKLGWTARGWTNWSRAWAENCCLVP